jgi:hypothetical protein
MICVWLLQSFPESSCRLMHGDVQGQPSLEAVASCTPPILKAVSNKAIQKASAMAEPRLNKSQAAAVGLASQRTLTLWQGPPGSGKTRTIVHYVCVMRHVTRSCGARILVCAGSNVAVDNLVAGLLGVGLGAVRVRQPAKVAPAVQAATLDALILEHPLGAHLASYWTERQHSFCVHGQVWL